ncbi:T-box transcription factor TBX6-like [Phlebotomus argentipes]|uniref:T-box transcription factor TBX6-like n=1 Tax=Phlebotomus argentipes TaxID=94469 RepID=UPI002892D07D|nr:T-box transcription factor TBX6-like [Phlebotomus argentipes]
MGELAEYRMHQHIAQEIYRQQILQRLPDPYPTMLPVPPPSRHFLPPAFTLTGIEAKLQNYELWNSFSPHGTEMIITKSGRRMFPSVRVTLAGLEEDASYCLMLEMVPIGDCRYKFSGSQWVPAGGAEPQSPQRMYLHPDSPALGSHWNSQPVSFSKVKLTNNTLDSNGHIVLTSMHKYKPRLHVIRTSEPSQIPWSPSQVFFFPDTDFVAVTAYQNDHITKLKIDNNPFAKGFRETGQSRCKRKTTNVNPGGGSGSGSSIALKSNVSLMATSLKSAKSDPTMAQSASTAEEASRHPPKRKRANSSSGSVSSLDDSGLSICGSSSRTSSPSTNTEDASPTRSMAPTAPGADLEALRGLPAPPEALLQHYSAAAAARSNWIDFALYFSRVSGLPLAPYQHPVPHHPPTTAAYDMLGPYGPQYPPLAAAGPFGGNVLMHLAAAHNLRSPSSPHSPHGADSGRSGAKSSFTIDAILGREEQN